MGGWGLPQAYLRPEGGQAHPADKHLLRSAPPLQGPCSVLRLKAGGLGNTQQTSQSAPSFHGTRGSPPPPTQPEGRESGGIRHQSKITKTVEEDLQQVDKGSKQVATYSILPRNPQALPTPALDLAFLLKHLRDWTVLSRTPEVG